MTNDGPGISRRTAIGGIIGGVAALSAVSTEALALTRSADGDPPRTTAVGPGAVPLDNRVTTDAQWAAFLRQQDLLWRKLPTTWDQGPFLGNGRLASGVYQEPGKNQVRFTVQHAEVQDHRKEYDHIWGRCRLPVGHLTLEPVGTITKVDLRLELWNAELTGSITTSKGRLDVRALVHSTQQVLAAQVTASGGEQVRWVFHPEEAISPANGKKPAPTGYKKNPPVTTRTSGDIRLAVQSLLAGGQTATAYRETAGTLFLSVAHTFPGTDAEAKARSALQAAVDFDALVASHRAWWHAYYRKSFVSIPDQRLQSFHWIQLYKIASGTRAGGPVMATSGPWLEPTPWPAAWWNLNVQLEYWLIHGSNHLELDAITTTLKNNQQQLINNVPSAYRSDSSAVGRASDMFCVRSVGTPGNDTEVGNLTWALHNVWLTYRHSMDDNLLRDTLFPLLRRAVNYYLHFLTTDGNGRMHLPKTLSPEYGSAPDCNYDLSLLRWGCRTLLDSAKRLDISDPLVPKWQQVLDKLTPFPSDANGYMVGAGVPFAQSHRHYSHLMMIYPLYLVNVDQAANRTIIQKSFDRWKSLPASWRGFSYAGAASIAAQLGRGDEALGYVKKFFDGSTRFPVRANTMYYEGGPVIETPLAFSRSLHDMLVQSWGGVIRVFPAVPTGWKDVTVHDFRTQGAFLVSAARTGGVTRFVRVRSLAGEPLRLRPGIAGPLTVVGDDGTPAVWRDRGAGVLEIDLARDREVLVKAVGSNADLVIAPVAVSTPGAAWGLP
jgi:alpha-L-fucosidase 2